MTYSNKILSFAIFTALLLALIPASYALQNQRTNCFDASLNPENSVASPTPPITVGEHVAFYVHYTRHSGLPGTAIYAGTVLSIDVGTSTAVILEHFNYTQATHRVALSDVVPPTDCVQYTRVDHSLTTIFSTGEYVRMQHGRDPRNFITVRISRLYHGGMALLTLEDTRTDAGTRYDAHWLKHVARLRALPPTP